MAEIEDDVEWCKTRLLILTGEHGDNGRIGLQLEAIAEEHERSATSQGTRIGSLESKVDTLERDMAEQKALKRGSNRVLVILGSVGMMVLGAILSELIRRF